MNEVNKCITIGIIGPSNVGKSTLVNALIGERISIVTDKVQTTRSVVKGIKNDKNIQMIFVDTPGIFVPKKSLEKIILSNALQGINDVDIIMLMIDAKKGITSNVINSISNIKNSGIKSFVVINKIDLIKKSDLITIIEKIKKEHDFDNYFMVSALRKLYLEDIIQYVKSNAKESEWLFPKNKTTDVSIGYRIREISREKFFSFLNQELPYSIVLENEKITKCKNGSILINQVLYVLKESHKKIIIGEKGKKISFIREKIERSLSYILNTRVKLVVFIKVQNDWVNKEKILSNIYD